jgi:hypothetical protein
MTTDESIRNVLLDLCLNGNVTAMRLWFGLDDDILPPHAIFIDEDGELV